MPVMTRYTVVSREKFPEGESQGRGTNGVGFLGTGYPLQVYLVAGSLSAIRKNNGRLRAIA